MVRSLGNTMADYDDLVDSSPAWEAMQIDCRSSHRWEEVCVTGSCLY
jgi:hypothetical protein